MRIWGWLLFLVLSWGNGVQAQIEQASITARALSREQIRQSLTPANLNLSLNPATAEAHWRKMLWYLTLIQPTNPEASQAMSQLLDLGAAPVLAPEVRLTLLSALRTAATLYLSPLRSESRQTYAFVPAKLRAILKTSRDPELLALSLSLLSQVEPVTDWLADIKSRQPLWFMHTRLRTTIEDLTLPPTPLPPLADLLQYSGLNLPQVYLLCRPDRRVPCLTLLKDAQGQYYQQDGQPWSLYLLARSIFPLAWNFSSGETPQGLMRLEGIKPRTLQEFRAFGQFPSIQVFLPNEPGVKLFLPGVAGTTPLDLGVYRSLWPLSWQGYRPIEESFWAGRLGRSLIRIHGSGEDPTLFYPDPVDLPNPTIGCIGAREQYGSQGELLEADLPRLLAAWQAVQPGDLGQLSGYLWVIELPGSSEPVRVSEVAGLLPTRGYTVSKLNLP